MDIKCKDCENCLGVTCKEYGLSTREAIEECLYENYQPYKEKTNSCSSEK